MNTENLNQNNDNTEIHIGSESEVRMVERVESKSLYEKINDFFIKMTPVKTREIVTMMRLLATMINAGITLLNSLKILTTQTSNPRLQRMLLEFVEKVEQGKNFSDCLAQYPDIFDDYTRGMIASGEASGRLNKVLVDIANVKEKNAKLASQIKGAMIYPVAVFFVMIAVFVAVMILVVPQFEELFSDFGSELPTITQMLVAMSDYLQESWYMLIVWMGLFFGAIYVWKNTKTGSYQWDWLMLRIPIFGNLQRKISLSRFTSSLGVLQGSGINITKALEINANAIGNEVYRRRVMMIREDVSQGITIAENIKNDIFLFPEIVVSMIDVGEQTATMDKIAMKVAEFYDDEVENTVKNLTTAMEPIIIIVLAVGVVFLVMAIMLPIFQLSEIASGI